MPTARIRASSVPAGLKGAISLDASGRPRYWPTVWAALDGAALQDGTLKQYLNAIDLLYKSAERMPGVGNLDRLISALDFDGIESCLTGLFVTQRNHRETSSEVWQRAISFIRQCLLRLSRTTELADERVGDINTKLMRMDQLYLSLRMPRVKRPEPIRALPSSVVEDVYEVILPESPRNPFRTETLRWRNFALILLLLHQGLRRSEALWLPLDALKHEWSPDRERLQYWLAISERRQALLDPRTDAASLKNQFAPRHVPMSEDLAQTLALYRDNFRGKHHHDYLFVSQVGAPLSKRSVTEICHVISSGLSAGARRDLKTLRGFDHLSAHAFRHTCAVVRLSQFMDSGDTMDLALQKLRVLFGWARGSTMPTRYARAYFEERLATVWADRFSAHVDALRGLESPAL